MDIDEIRRTNIRAIERELGSPTALATAVGMSYAQYQNTRDGAKEAKTGKKRGMRKETAWRFEDAGGKPRGWLDMPHDSFYQQFGHRPGITEKDDLDLAYAKALDERQCRTWQQEIVDYYAQPRAQRLLASGSPGRMSIGHLLEEINTITTSVAPVLQAAYKDALIKWMTGNASTPETAATLEALVAASKSLPFAAQAYQNETHNNVPGVAGQVLAKKLTAESADFQPARNKV